MKGLIELLLLITILYLIGNGLNIRWCSNNQCQDYQIKIFETK